MASAPPELPESIVVGSFAGIKNTVSEERLGQNDLSAAVNVDIDDAGQLRRRRGRRRVSTAHHHSLVDMGRLVLVVREGTLGVLASDYTFTPIVPVGFDPIAYTRVGDTIYFGSRSASGKIVDGQALPWGEHGGDGQWISPVIRPTETLGAINGKLLSAVPYATEIESYKGRIYLAADNVLWVTELYLYDKLERTKGFIYLEDPITMLRSVSDGLYVGTTAQLLFLQGTFAEGLKLSTVMNCGVVQGSSVLVPWSKVHPRARTQPVPEGYGPVFMTSDGICLGLDNGEVYNLTQEKVVFPGAVRAAALYREDQGANTYIAVADSAGGPSANARIGDYVDAEIVRASQGA